MLALPDPYLNGVRLTHPELAAIHVVMRQTIHDATREHALDGPRLLRWENGEKYTLKAHGRSREGFLLASVNVYLPWARITYTRRVRLIKDGKGKPVV